MPLNSEAAVQYIVHQRSGTFFFYIHFKTWTNEVAAVSEVPGPSFIITAPYDACIVTQNNF
jgi:hypothetical protein